MDKPKQVFYKASYWACNRENHRHLEERVAMRCIEKNTDRVSTKKERGEAQYRTLSRYCDIFEKFLNGQTLDSLALEYKIAKSTVSSNIDRIGHQICYTHYPEEDSFPTKREILRESGRYLEKIEMVKTNYLEWLAHRDSYK